MPSPFFFLAKPYIVAACTAVVGVSGCAADDLSTGDAHLEGVKSVLDSVLSDSGKRPSLCFQSGILGSFVIIGG